MKALDVRKFLHYSKRTGTFVWRVRTSKKLINQAGSIAGTTVSGYRVITINGRHYRAARLAFAYVNGAWPVGDMDHINGIPLDDRWENLRNVSHQVNLQNARSRPNSLGVRGVARNGSGYLAQIRANGRYFYLGTYRTVAEAGKVYVAARKALHPGARL